MAQIEGEITIDRTVDDVFDFVADERNEPRFNPQMTSVDKLSDGEIGLGTQFCAEVKSGGRPLSMVIEFISFERPHRLKSRTTMSGMVILGELTFESVGEGRTRMLWAWEMQPSGAMRLLKPLSRLHGPSSGACDLEQPQAVSRSRDVGALSSRPTRNTAPRSVCRHGSPGPQSRPSAPEPRLSPASILSAAPSFMPACRPCRRGRLVVATAVEAGPCLYFHHSAAARRRTALRQATRRKR